MVAAAALFAAALPLGRGATAQYAQDQPWVHERPPGLSPAPRYSPAMAAHTPSGKVVLFGGVDTSALVNVTGRSVLEDTWTWNGRSWEEDRRPGPPSRYGAKMAYHAASGKVVLFGGVTGSGPADDTWTWDPTAGWDHQENLSVRPPARGDAVMAEHPTSGTVVLFGGSSNGEMHGALGDTWTWDGSAWSEQRPLVSPSARTEAAMAYHAGTQRVVLFSGRARSAPEAEIHYDNATWTWDGTTWRQESTAERPWRRWLGAMAPHEAAGEVVLFGGYGTLKEEKIADWDDTWTWDGKAWAHRSPATSPSTSSGARPYAAMAYHGPTERVVLFGGGSDEHDLSGDTWTWDARRTTTGLDVERRTTVAVDPGSIPADGASTATATATVTVGTRGGSGLRVSFQTDGDVRFGPVRDHGDGRYTTTVTASATPGREIIVAVAHDSTGATELARGSTKLTETQAECAPFPASDGPPRWSDLDPSFGCHGKVLSRPGGHAQGMALQGDKILVAAGPSLVRFNENGTMDPRFGDGGVVNGEPGFSALAVQLADAKIVVAGDGYLSRLERDGSPDAGFGAGDGTPDGRIATGVWGRRLVVDDDGNIVLAARVETPYNWMEETGGAKVRLVRYTREGELDTGFGSNGSTDVSFASTGQSNLGDVALQRDGNIVIAGQRIRFSTGRSEFALARLTRRGHLDPSFGNGGAVLTEFEGYTGSGAVAIAVQEDGNIVAGGYAGPPTFALARYHSEDGSLDETFNPCVPAAPPCNGKVVAPARFTGWEARPKPPLSECAVGDCGGPFGPVDAGWPSDIALQPDGRIVMAGYGPFREADFLVARYNANGTLDACPPPGWARTRFAHSATAAAVAVLPDSGKILLAGHERDPKGGYSLALARYRGGPSGGRTLSITPDLEVGEPASGTAPARFTVRLNAPACSPVSVAYTTRNDGAEAGSDYTAVADRVRFQEGDIEKVIEVPVLADAEVEDPEQFTVDLSEPRDEAQGGPAAGLPLRPSSVRIEAGTGRATIRDAGPHARISPHVSVPEHYSAPVTARFTVTLSGVPRHGVSVAYRTVAGTATDGADYVAEFGRLGFAPGETSKFVDVRVNGDDLPEPDEDFFVELSDPSGLVVAGTRGRGTILDAGPGVSIGSSSAVEGNVGTTTMSFAVTANIPAAEAATVDYTTVDGEAKAKDDYVATSGRVTFAAGEGSKLLAVPVVTDTVFEPTESFVVRLTSASGGVVLRPDGTGTIHDDDEPLPSTAPPSERPAAGPAASASPPGPVTLVQAEPPAPAPGHAHAAHQAQGQAHAQAQQQAQQQAQGQAQAAQQAQAQAAQQTQAQAQVAAQAQAQLQPGLMFERERGIEVERARSGGPTASPQSYLASARERRGVAVGAPVVWVAALASFGAALRSQRGEPSPARVRLTPARRARRRRTARQSLPSRR